MKTFKVFLKDYSFETITAENFAIDEQNNLVVGQNLFHCDDWKKILFLYEGGLQAGLQGYTGEIDPYPTTTSTGNW